MAILDKLYEIKNILHETPGIKTNEELNILIEIGYHQEQGSPLTWKQLLLLRIAPASTLRRYLNSLVSIGMVEKFASDIDNRSVMFRLNAPAIRLLTKHYFRLVKQLDRHLDSLK